MRSKKQSLIFIGLILSLYNVAKAEPSAATVSSQKLSDIFIEKVSSTPARTLNPNHALIASETNARVVNVGFEQGDFVKKDQLLIQLDCRDFINQKKQAQAALKAAKAQRDLSEKQYQRNQRLISSNTISKDNLDITVAQRNQAISDVELRKTQLEAANIAIDKCNIKAPYDGQITERHISTGDYVTLGKPVFKLLSQETPKIEADLTPRQQLSLREASAIYFLFEGQRKLVRLKSMLNIVSAQTNTSKGRFEFNEQQDVLVGMQGRIEWKDTNRHIPATFVVKRGGTLGVFITKDKTTALFHALPDVVEGQPAKTSLPADTLLITSNLFTLKDKMKITTK